MIKGEIRYMTVRHNWLDQLIGSNWIRRTNPERPTVGRGLPAEGCLSGQVKDFSAKYPDFHCTRVFDYSEEPS